jgi:group I intron endonuclease
MKIDQPGVYCFWNKINNKVYVGSAQDLTDRLKKHFNSRSSNIHLQNAIKKYGLEAFHISQVKTETHADALQLEQRCLDYLFGKDKLRYNIADKVSGGCIGSKENHTKLCLQSRTKVEHRELSAQNGGFKAKPFFIKEYPSNKPLLEATSTCDEKAQELLKMDFSRICYQLTQNDCLLFIRLNSGQIAYLEYTDQSLCERAKLLGRSIESDYNKIMGFHLEKQALNLRHKDGRTVLLENYASYFEAGKMLGFKTRAELSCFSHMVAGRCKSAYGWSLTV